MLNNTKNDELVTYQSKNHCPDGFYCKHRNRCCVFKHSIRPNIYLQDKMCFQDGRCRFIDRPCQDIHLLPYKIRDCVDIDYVCMHGDDCVGRVRGMCRKIHPFQFDECLNYGNRYPPIKSGCHYYINKILYSKYEPKIVEEPRFRDESGFRDESRFREEPRFRDESRFREEPRFRDESRFREEPRFRDESRFRERSRSYDRKHRHRSRSRSRSRQKYSSSKEHSESDIKKIIESLVIKHTTEQKSNHIPYNFSPPQPFNFASPQTFSFAPPKSFDFSQSMPKNNLLSINQPFFLEKIPKVNSVEVICIYNDKCTKRLAGCKFMHSDQIDKCLKFYNDSKDLYKTQQMASKMRNEQPIFYDDRERRYYN
jgi:hypothetical protein